MKLTSRDKELLKKLDMEHQKKVQLAKEEEKKKMDQENLKKDEAVTKITAVPNPKSRQKVSEALRGDQGKI